jgi:stress-induced morphogen
MSSSIEPSASQHSSSSSSLERSSTEDHVKCSICGQQFEDMAEMQRHMLTEHIQKGDLPSEQS